ncbi:MAG: hypothetical protein Q8L60_13540, partial [Gammaproteobacteria bacterium]|nr:hypothetical protein [Gammaproteobacteria bacterium]
DDYYNPLTWSIDFTGGSLTNPRGAMAGMSLTSGSGRLTNVNGSLVSSTIAGSIAGMYVDSGAAFVSAFNLYNTAATGGEHISGTILTEMGIGWGAWDNPVGQNWNADGLGQSEVNAYFDNISSAVPHNLTGSYDYGTSNPAAGFIGASSEGYIISVDANFRMNFDTGVISGGSLQVVEVDSYSSDHYNWNVSFDGTLNGGALSLNATNAEVALGSSPAVEATATLGGLFTGAGAEQFLGGFDLVKTSDADHFVQGLYTLTKTSIQED